jgi:hypothetical protein
MSEQMSRVGVLDAIQEWRNRYEWTGELAGMGEWESVNHRPVLEGIYMMWRDYRETIEPMLDAALMDRDGRPVKATGGDEA